MNDECEQKGHDYEVLAQPGTERPGAVICARCGERWMVISE